MKLTAILFCLLLCCALLTGCGSRQQSSVPAETTQPQYDTQCEEESSVPPAVRERPHLSSALEDNTPS